MFTARWELGLEMKHSVLRLQRVNYVFYELHDEDTNITQNEDYISESLGKTTSFLIFVTPYYVTISYCKSISNK